MLTTEVENDATTPRRGRPGRAPCRAVCGRLDLARERPRPPPVRLRTRSVRSGPASRDRRRGRRGQPRPRAGGRCGLLRRHAPDERQDGHDPDGRRVLGHAAPPRVDRGAEGRRRRRGRRRGRDRPERRRRGGRAVRPSRHPPDRGRAGLRRSKVAAAPACARAARARCAVPCPRGSATRVGRPRGLRHAADLRAGPAGRARRAGGIDADPGTATARSPRHPDRCRPTSPGARSCPCAGRHTGRAGATRSPGRYGAACAARSGAHARLCAGTPAARPGGDGGPGGSRTSRGSDRAEAGAGAGGIGTSGPDRCTRRGRPRAGAAPRRGRGAGRGACRAARPPRARHVVARRRRHGARRASAGEALLRAATVGAATAARDRRTPA